MTDRNLFGQLRVMVVEDSPTEAACLEFLLMKNGYAVTIVQDGAEAIESIVDATPALVITDVVMPNMDGYALCAELKGDPGRSGIPVVLLTGLIDPASVLRGLASGADDFLLKPYGEGALMARIRALLEAGGVERRGAVVTVTCEGVDYKIEEGALERIRALRQTYDADDNRHAALREVERCIGDELRQHGRRIKGNRENE